jgi:3-oxoacyl-[acyl-carrier protein] reductase
VRADVSKPAEAKALVNAAVAEFGKVDILVNNAGVYEFLPLESITEKHFDRLFDLNVRGLVFTTQAAAGAFGDGGGRSSISDRWLRKRRRQAAPSTVLPRGPWTY